jgi:2-oxoglutarate ferredoxin oxidoreductase subunit beta
MTEKPLSFCPGCGHGVVHRIIMEVIDEMGIQADTIGVAPVGCSVLAYEFMDIDMQQASHGRAPAVATGIKRCWPQKFVFSYQGDGDLAARLLNHACVNGKTLPCFLLITEFTA